MTHFKNAELKADAESGTITGYFSTYHREPDSYGDVIAKGAFTDTIAKRKESGHPFPLCWNHSLEAEDIIGKVTEIVDTDNGPLMTAEFFDTPRAQLARELVKSGAIYQFSFAFDILDEGPVELGKGQTANELRKLDLFEISIVPIPANQHAQVVEIKEGAPEVKAGKRNSKKDADAIKQAITLLQGVLDSEESEEDTPTEDAPEANAKAEEPTASNEAKSKLLETIKSFMEETT